ncbi:MAG: glycoside hydrolase family 15 protein [Planctomycetota bacterium]|nr:MAG: glycoside hydrolase family 15 protein [Planctomycetota bacterium]
MSKPEPAANMRLEHGIIGNGNLLALVHPESSIDWLCMPRFDSPSVFARLLDEERGGTWRFLVDGQVVRGKMRYVRNTNVLQTVFEHDGCQWELFDFCPRIPQGLHVRAPLRLMRYLRPIKGQPRLTVQFDPRPGYGREKPKLIPTVTGVALAGTDEPISVFSNVPAPFIINGHPFRLDRPRYFGMDYGRLAARQHLDQVAHEFDLTIAGWRQWTQAITLPGFADDLVIRSALCLKLHAYEETGAIIAASTTSIPEAVGEPRTWDYRYCWLRDSVFTVEALRRIGHFQEGRNFIQFVRDVAESGPLQPLYGVGGERDLPEMELEHLAGFRGTRPVRVGNQAAEQNQTDMMGEVILCLRTLLTDKRMKFPQVELWFPLVERMVKEARAASGKPDVGIWEYRSGPRVHLFSQAMCWAAIHHGACLAHHFKREDLAQKWQEEADEMARQLLDDAYHSDLGMFTETLGGQDADASVLLLPALGLIHHQDPRFQNTLKRYREVLVRGDGVMRYVHNDDFGEPRSAFTICAFWWAEALAHAGYLEEAIDMFNRVTAHANDLGLLSEDVDLESGELIGNFPQAYTHVGLINAATTIGTFLRIRDGRFHAWT